MKKLIAFLIIAAVAYVSWGLWYRRAISPVNTNDTARVIVTVPSGSSTTAIADILVEKDLIRSTFAFTRFVKKSENAGALKAGTFVFGKNMAVRDIVGILVSGKGGEVIITIPEGYTVSDIDALLAEKGVTRPGGIVECARTCDFSSFEFLPQSSVGSAPRGGRIEGYLYPDTYYVAMEGFEPKFFLERLLTTYRKKVLDGRKDAVVATGRSLHEIMTMASLIEEETRTDEERPVVAGILWKRYDAGMGLGVDAAVRYVLEKPAGKLTVADLNVDSPYNLRKFRGLPPGPIASPGLKSIEAAIEPEESPYWYYLHGKDGVIRYAVTNEEHNLNKAKYLR